MSASDRILWIQNHPSPQTVGILNDLAKEFPGLHVFYREMGSKGRGWGELHIAHSHTPRPRSGFLGQFLEGARAARRSGVLVTSGYSSSLQVGAILSARARHVPIFMRSDSSGSAERRKPKLHRLVKQGVLRGLLGSQMRVWTVGTDNSDYWRMYGLRNQFEIPFESPVQEPAATFSPESGRLLYVGRLSFEKGVDVLIEAGELLAARGVDFRLEVVGEGPLSGSMPQRTWARYSGAVAHADLGERYCRATALVVPSRRDAFGLVVKEALQFGLPVVGTEVVPTIHELCDKGWNRVPPSDPVALSRAMERALEEPRWSARPPINATKLIVAELRRAETGRIGAP